MPKIDKGNFIDIYEKYKCTGDKKVVLRTEVVKQYDPYPEYKNEKLVPLGCLYNLIGEHYNYIYSNEIYCIVEYLEGGSSHAILKQYKQSPKGFAYARKINNRITQTASLRIKNAVHIGSSAIFAKDIGLLKEKGRTFWNVLMFPAGVLLNCYIRLKTIK